MALKGPGLLTFLVSLILAVAVLYAKLFSPIPFLAQDSAQFFGLLAAYVILLLGCTMRGL